MKKNVFTKVLALCLAFVLCMGTLAGCGAKQLTAKELFDLTVTNQENQLNDGVITLYGNTLDSVGANDGVTLNIKATLGDAVKSLLSSAMGGSMKFDWLNEIGLKIGGKNDKGNPSGQVDISLNGTALASVKSVIDTASEKMLIAVPDFLDGALSMDMKNVTEQMADELSLKGDLKSAMDVKSWMPDAATLKKIVEKYVKIVLENITEITKEEATVEAGGLSQKCSKLVTTITADTYKKILTSVADTLEKDTDVAGIFDKMGTVFDVKSSDVVPEMVENFRSSAESAEGQVNAVLYADDKGGFVGMDVAIKSNGEEMTMKVSAPEQDGKTALNAEITSPDGEQKITVTGSGTKNGNAAEGSYVLAFNGAEILTIDAKDSDTTKSQKGIINGSYTIKAGKGLADMMNSIGSNPMVSLLTQFSIQADVAMTDAKNGKCGISLLDNSGSKFISLDIEETAGFSGDVTIAADKAVDMTDQSALMGVFAKVNFNSLIEKLTSVGVPSELTDSIKSIAALLGGNG